MTCPDSSAAIPSPSALFGFAWHLTSVAWLGLAGILVASAQAAPPSAGLILRIVAATCFVTSAAIALASGGKHLAWPVFLAVALLAWSVQ
jgi:hypothetical protein